MYKWSDYPATEPWATCKMQLVSEQSKNPPLAAGGAGGRQLEDVGGPGRTMADEAGMSRLYGGIHS
ncbi:MAG: hypothetical protein ABR511_01585 [Acidimicrobiales bacterium]